MNRSFFNILISNYSSKLKTFYVIDETRVVLVVKNLSFRAQKVQVLS
jgi:hypothetical protein